MGRLYFFKKTNQSMKPNYLLCVLLILFSCSKKETPKVAPSVSQSCQKLDELIKNNCTDTLQIKEALTNAYTLAEKVSIKEHDSLIMITSYVLGSQLEKVESFTVARIYYKNGLRLGLKQLQKNALRIAHFYHNIGITYYRENNFNLALTYLDSCKTDTNNKEAWVLKTQNQIDIAECYNRLKNTKAATYLYESLIPLVKLHLSEKDKGRFYTRYSLLLRDLKQFQKSVEMGQQSVNILSKWIEGNKCLKADSILLANAYFSIGFAFQDSLAYKASEPFYLKALSLYKSVNNMENYRRSLLNMGLMYRYDKRFDKAEEALSEGIISLNKEAQTDFNIMKKGKLFNNRSEVFMDTKQYKKALADQDSAIYYLTLYDKRASLTTLLMSNRKSLLSTYENKAKIYALYEENGSDTEGSLKALKYTRDIIKIADDIRADYFSDEAKLTLANDVKPALEKAISVCQKLYVKTRDKQYLEQAFGFVEYSRSMVLYENARLDNQLPPDLKAENEALKKREAALIAKNNVEDLQNYLRLKRQFREKIKALNRNQLATVSELKQALIKDDKTAIIEFFVGDSAIFVFTLIQNDLKLIELKKQKDFDKQIENLRQEITQANPVRDAANFEKQSKIIYNSLLTNTIAQLPTTIHQLIMAPDGVLNYLPFEILIKGDPSVYSTKNDLKNDGVTSKNDVVTSSHPVIKPNNSSFKNTHFLLKNYQISYAYSANLLLEQKRLKKESAPKLFAGFAAKYENKDTTFAIADVSRAVLTREGAYELKGANEEVKSISDLVGGKAYLNEFATEGSFKKEANQYKILHFAMHSLTDDKDPSLSKLLFTLTPKDTTNDNDLTAAELYATSLKADLAVLSACNTGFGTLNKGEGVMSLARAFTYAGVPSTVTSLWKVPDMTTREIMVDFYKNLKLGMTKDAALRQAKLTYLENAPESIAANPYFWAGFVPMGNMEAMDFSERGPLSIGGILAGILGLCIGFWLYKRRDKTPVFRKN
jgi:CHAT domain-containing protein